MDIARLPSSEGTFRGAQALHLRSLNSKLVKE